MNFQAALGETRDLEDGRMMGDDLRYLHLDSKTHAYEQPKTQFPLLPTVKSERRRTALLDHRGVTGVAAQLAVDAHAPVANRDGPQSQAHTDPIEN
jgi:hypothetical protein